MKVELDILSEIEIHLKELIMNATKDALLENQKMLASKQWFSLKEAAEYAGVSYNSFLRFRAMGLPISEIGAIKRVSKKEIDEFLHKNSF